MRNNNFLEHFVSDKGIQPVNKKLQYLKNLNNADNKKDVMHFLGNLGLHNTLHVDSKPSYELLKHNVPFI